MSVHLTVHYLDIIRHFVAFASQPFNWITNITASIVTFFILSLLWPRARRRYKVWFEGHMTSLHLKMDTQHAEHLATMHRHHAEHMKALSNIAPVKKATPTKAVAPVKKATRGTR